MSTYLVTGGCGFIGSHLVDALLAAGHQVRVLDDLSSGRLENLPPAAELLQGSVAHAASVREALSDVDGCFHLAAIASVERCKRDWEGTHQVNQTGTIVLLDAIRRMGRALPLVYASSAAVYGNTRILPLTEASPARPVSAYGADKLACELQAAVAGASFGVPTAGLRFFNVFGPRQDPTSPYSGVISLFCQRMAKAETITIFGDGAQTRDFVAVGDVVAALVAALAHADPGAPVFNVCTGRATSVRSLAETIASILGTTPRVTFGPARTGEVRHSVGSPAKARAVLDLPEPISLQAGLPAVLAWVRSGGAVPIPLEQSE